MDDDQVRIPELPIFKRFSLALRQEFAEAAEVLGYLEATVDRVRLIVERAERKKVDEQRIEDPSSREDQSGADPDDLAPEIEEEAPSLREKPASTAPKKSPKPTRRKPVKRPQVIRVPDDAPSKRSSAKKKVTGKTSSKTRRR